MTLISEKIMDQVVHLNTLTFVDIFITLLCCTTSTYQCKAGESGKVRVLILDNNIYFDR